MVRGKWSMPQVDECLKLAASNFKIAEAHLEDAEVSLHTLLEKLDYCLERLKNVPRDASLLREQPDIKVPGSQPMGAGELDLVKSWKSTALPN